jgi:hypothetical protein
MTKEETDECTVVEYAQIATLIKETQADILNYAKRLEQKCEGFKTKKKPATATFVERLIKRLKETAEYICTE